MIPYIFILLTAYMNQFQHPTINIVKGQWKTLETDHFFHATTGAVVDYATKVRIKADETHLHVAFECQKDAFVDQNFMTKHNDPLYNQEVFEVFIAAGKDDPSEYLEVEINPNNATWVGKMTNPSLGSKNDIKGNLLTLKKSELQHSASKGNQSWSGTLSIPWVLIAAEKHQQYRLNFYRIVSKKAQTNPNWVCTIDNCDFLCWSATMSGTIPAFHRPRKFGLLTIGDE
jgi:hypothetical protein